MLELTLDVVVSLFVLVIYFAQEREVSRQASEVPSDYLNDVLPCVNCGAEDSHPWGLCDACEVETHINVVSFNKDTYPVFMQAGDAETGDVMFPEWYGERVPCCSSYEPLMTQDVTDTYSVMSIRELKKQASKMKVKKYGRLTKQELIEALAVCT